MSSRQDYEPFICRRHWNDSELDGVGFFEDGHNRETLNQILNDKRWVTPTEHLAAEGVVLCTTGAFAPLHAGHVDMLMAARDQLEAKGIKVAGALIQPDHDAYVKTKHVGARCAADRIEWAQSYVKDIPWIAVDPWPSTYQDRQLNYTTILRRTERYLKRQVVYVFGSDNAGFADAFLPHEYVCVPRTAISSTQVRPTAMWPVWGGPNDFEGDYLIRDDLPWATQRWNVPPGKLAAFMLDLISAYHQVWPGYWARTVKATNQQVIVDEQIESIVNFDTVTGGSHWVTRLFHPCTSQVKPVDWRMSPLELIPAGKHVLVDDDIASGSTVRHIREKTPQVEWVGKLSLAQALHRGAIFDICDARDFLFGSRQGGLGIKYRGSHTRAPYINPWVDLTRRAKIPPVKQAAFTRAIIAANIRFFEACPITVAETGNSEFWQLLGYALDTPMQTISMDLLSWNPNP